MDAVTFEWRSIEDDNVKGFYVYRSNPDSNSTKLKRIANYNKPTSTHYLDTNLKPATLYKYRFSTYDKEFHESTLSKTFSALTQEPIERVALFKNVDNLPRQAKLIWRPHPNEAVNRYEIFRRIGADDTFKKVATLSNRLYAEFIDYNLDDGKDYYYKMRAVTFDDVTSEFTPIVKVTTKALPPKLNFTQATTNLPKEIALQWTKSTIEDFAYYNLYRSEYIDGNYEYYAKLLKNEFHDNIKEDGKIYYYRVSVVDTDGLESRKSQPIKGETLVDPKAPVILSYEVKNRNGVIKFQATKRAVKFKIIKTIQHSFISSEKVVIDDINTTTFTDTGLKPNTKYSYEVIAIDKYNLESLPSNPINLYYEE